MIQVKICGINDAAAFDAAVQSGADWVGFVFFPPSPRYVTPDQALALSSRSPSGPPRVGLFVDPAPEDIGRTLDIVPLDILQLYGAEKHLAEIKRTFGRPIWRAVGVSAPSDLPAMEDRADRLLIEAKPPKDATRPGGNSMTFEWRITNDWKAPVPWILAGGLTPANVAEAIALSGAPAVDVSSGVEASKGVKDPALIRAFIKAAKGAAD
ncbi:MAG TPA: phosphoribosylanthranilate isomerase [Rhodopila sp.]|uniref:phosphoribosylanthranilate isomerase n=1 Tax=Rhodopila sp. TaxID=2480087 RepID=UPI002B6F9819|nr:phosphoribosylanthranilate isomerase [Rhodopila sp.]HVY16901.1 phosphoribosylanthranilate isomerase [Rhodopila sp.]